ncbi:MAG: EndoU domain-containing protein [Muricauda sp.]|nr:EndoU domain-containing protein [Allomuricauda sp.]MBA4746270.1 EndoU domain-containing protein [Allomuricauda sp.]
MKYQFFIFEDTFNNNPQGLKSGVSITKIPAYIKIAFEKGEGPFQSLRNLKRNSKIFLRLKQTNPRRAQQIVKEQHIHTVAGMFSTPHGSEYQIETIDLFSHCTKGRVKNGSVTGVHFYDPLKVKIINVLKENDETGVFEAEFEYYNSSTKKWIKKRSSSTFFPRTWQRGKLLQECQNAYDLIKGSKPNNGIVLSKTSEGIEVEIVFKEGALKSIYPLI